MRTTIDEAPAPSGAADDWDRIVREHQHAVLRLAYLMTDSADTAADVAQEAFVRAWRSRDRFEEGRPLRPWLLRIAANVARNRHRTRRRYLSALKRALVRAPESVLGADPTPLDNSSVDAEVVRRAIRTLHFRHQEVIFLRYFMDLTLAETADALSVPEGTAKSRTHRALSALRDSLSGSAEALE